EVQGEPTERARLGGHRTAERLGDVGHDAHAESRTAGLARARVVESLEALRARSVERQSRAPVLNDERRLVVRGGQCHVKGRVTLRMAKDVIEGVAEEAI